MKKSLIVLTMVLVCTLAWPALTLIHGDLRVDLEDAVLSILPQISFQTGFHSTPHTQQDVVSTEQLRGIPFSTLLGYLGVIGPEQEITLIAEDGFAKALPARIFLQPTAMGIPVLALTRNDQSGQWMSFMVDGNQLTNEKMFEVLGERYSHYQRGALSARGLLIRDLRYVVVDWDSDMDRLAAKDPGPSIAAEPVDPPKEDTDGWQLLITGAQNEVFTLREAERLISCRSHVEERSYERRGAIRTYVGVPLWILVSMSDLSGDRHPYVFDRALWDAGYSVTLTALDGYSVGFETSEMDPDAIFVAWMLNGEPILPTTVGDVSSMYWVKDLVSIQLGLEEVDRSEEDYQLELVTGSQIFTIPLKDLIDSEYVVEGVGMHTRSTGRQRVYHYRGIHMARLLVDYLGMTESDTVRVTALDWYETHYDASEVLDESEGTWILAFEMDGLMLPENPGPLRTVKIGEGVDIDGHSAIKMVKRIEVVKEAYISYVLKMRGLLDKDIDRHTMETGISCHRVRVVYESRGNRDEYAGIPVWMMLAYSDDPLYAPHHQDKSIISYDAQRALAGYDVVFTASDGYSIILSSIDLHENPNIIIANQKNGVYLDDAEGPLMLVFDSQAPNLPQGIRRVRNLVSIELLLD